MKEQDLFGDYQDDSILEYFDDVQEKSGFPSLLAELNALLRQELIRLGVNPAHSLELVVAICNHIGGIQGKRLVRTVLIFTESSDQL
ncbi:hypothetical protein FSF59_022840, partial [Escherichia coli]|nr:hypothetical protein [Escherichia coli]